MIRSTKLTEYIGNQDGENVRLVWDSSQSLSRILLCVGDRYESIHLDVFAVLAKRASRFVQAISEEMAT